MTETPGNPTTSPGAIKAVEDALRRLGARIRLALLTQRMARVLAAALAVVLILTVADYFLRLPAGLRWIHLLIGLAALGWVVWRFIIPACRLRPTLATLALRVEKSHPELAGVLASGVEFDTDPMILERAGAFERALARRVADEAANRFEPDDLKGLLRANHLMQAAGSLAVALVAAALIVVASPDLAVIGATRTLAPWTDAQWPKRTAVVDATGIDVHPLGAAIPLRAALTRSVRTPDRTDVSVEHRPIRSGSPGAIRRELMTWQQRDIDASEGAGALYERLIETDAEAIEYRFVTFDDRTPWRRVRLVPPPAIAEAQAVITPPAYAAALSDEGLAAPLTEPTTVNLGDGTDERAIAPPVLAGSRIELTLALNKPLQARPDDLAWLAGVFGDDLLVARASRPSGAGLSFNAAEGAETQWSLSWTIDESVRLPVTLVDEHGIESTTESVFRFESVQDRPATATVTEPAQDLSVLATAVVRVVGEGRDDVGLNAVWLERQRVRPAGAGDGQPSGPGGAVEPLEDPIEIIRRDADGARVLAVEHAVDLAPLGLRPGDQLWLTAVADDVYVIAGAAHEPTRSITRVLRIIDETEFISEIRAELSALRQGAIRLFDDQQDLRELDAAERAATEALRRQAQLSERIARLDEQLSRVRQRVEDNALNDRQLDNVLDDARRFIQESGRWSGRAAERMEDAAERDASNDEDRPLDREEERQIDDAQQRVQDELAGLAELLDTGEDAWVARRQLEALLNEQMDLQERTGEAGRETTGRTADELTPQERSELERIVDKQLELAQQAEELAQELEERARALEEHDPAAAGGMRQAARRARQSQVSETMQQAAQQAEQNQMAQAGEQQQQAVEDLQQMLEDMDDAERTREEVLRRVLASLIESLEALIEQQRAEIDRLADARVDRAFAGLDQGMIRLNQNTLAVLDQASAAGREVAPVASVIGRAVDAQTEAIIALRAAPVDDVRADDQERRSLELLQQARDEAERLDEEMRRRQQERARDELRQAYREALERQVAIRAETGEFAPLEDLDRRQRAAVRRLSQQQRAIAETLRELLVKSEELSEAAIFDYVHQRLDEEIEDAAARLDDGDIRAAIPPEDIAVALLQGLVEALKEPPPQSDDFAQGAGGGGGGGESGGGEELIPPIAQLRLLRQIQIDLARRTRLVGDAGGDPVQAERLGREQARLGELGQDLVRQMQQQQQPPQPQEQPQ